ncbi:MAG: TetR/AcrR family transcriptional regulator [Acidobacteriota bacterium]|nr:TetR/AcrR family transcriptional regulator [Acidobacteriota bacterium]
MVKSIFTTEEETRRKGIVTTSLAIVDEYGIKGLTVARIAREVGFAESALYRHFKSKKEIILFILNEANLLAKNQFQEIRDSSENPLKQIKLLLKKHLEFLQEFPGIFPIIYSDEIHIGETFLLEKLEILINELTGFIKEIIENGKASKRIKQDVDAALAAIHILGIIQTAFSYWTIKKRKISLIEIGDKLLSQLFSGITI